MHCFSASPCQPHGQGQNQNAPSAVLRDRRLRRHGAAARGLRRVGEDWDAPKNARGVTVWGAQRPGGLIAAPQRPLSAGSPARIFEKGMRAVLSGFGEGEEIGREVAGWGGRRAPGASWGLVGVLSG